MSIGVLQIFFSIQRAFSFAAFLWVRGDAPRFFAYSMREGELRPHINLPRLVRGFSFPPGPAGLFCELNMLELQTLVDIGIGVVTLLTAVAGAAGSVWLFFRRRLRAWWAPYRAGIEGMGRLPELDAAIKHVSDELAGVRDSMTMLALTMQARSDANAERAEFDCAEDGRNVRVNRTFARWLGVSAEELMGWGFLNFIHPDDRAGVRQEWSACRAEHRTYDRHHRLVTAAGGVIPVHTICNPVPNAPPARAWFGSIRRLDGGE